MKRMSILAGIASLTACAGGSHAAADAVRHNILAVAQGGLGTGEDFRPAGEASPALESQVFQPGADEPGSQEFGDAQPDMAEVTIRPEPFRWDWRSIRAERFDGFPREIRDPLLRNAKENSLCRGGSGGNRSTLRACNRRDGVMAELMKLGWCWGGSDTGAFMRWLRCNDDPSHDPSALLRSDPPYFSEAEIEDAFEDEPRSPATR